MKHPLIKAIFVCAILCVSLYAAVVLAQSDLESPTLVSLSISPEYVNTSVGDQVITVTAHIIDNLSGCSESGGPWCLQTDFIPRFGPRSQIKQMVFTSYQLITGTLTDGIYQQSFTLPQYSFEGEWVLFGVYLVDRVNNSCGLPYLFGKYCPFDMPVISFTNKKIEALNFLPSVGNPPTPFPLPTPTPSPTPTNAARVSFFTDSEKSCLG